MGILRKVVILCGAAALCAAAADVQLLTLAMPDARVLAGANTARIKGSPFGQFLLSRVTSEGERDLQGFIASTGFDPRRDLDEVLFAAPGGSGSQRRLVLARGNFNPAQVLAFARSNGAQVTSYQGIDILSPAVRQVSGAHSSPGVLAFLSNKLAAAGDVESVRGAIDRSRAGAPVALAPNVVAQVNQLSTADAWFLSLVPFSDLAARAPEGDLGGALKGDALKKIQQTSGTVQFGATIQACAQATTATAQDATSLAEVLRFLAGMVQLGGNPGTDQFRSLLASLNIAAQDQTVTLGLSIPEAQVESLIAQKKPTP